MKKAKKRRITLLIGALTLGGLALTFAPISHGQTQAEMNATAATDFKRADAAMNAAYQKLMSAVGKDKQPKLKAAQRVWLKFRDAETAFLSSKASGGSIYPTIAAENKTTLTQQRTEGLNKAYKLFTTEGEL